MGTTTQYLLRYPEAAINFVRDGAQAIQQLAQDVEAALLPPLLAVRGAQDPQWSSKVGQVGWNMASPSRSRGAWTSAASGQLVIPPSYGIYLATTSVRFGGKAEADVFGINLETRVDGDLPVVSWAQQQIEVADTSSSYTQLSCSAIIPITTANQGIQVTARYVGATAPDTGAPDSVHRLQIYRLSAL